MQGKKKKKKKGKSFVIQFAITDKCLDAMA